MMRSKELRGGLRSFVEGVCGILAAFGQKVTKLVFFFSKEKK